MSPTAMVSDRFVVRHYFVAPPGENVVPRIGPLVSADWSCLFISGSTASQSIVPLPQKTDIINNNYVSLSCASVTSRNVPCFPSCAPVYEHANWIHVWVQPLPPPLPRLKRYPALTAVTHIFTLNFLHVMRVFSGIHQVFGPGGKVQLRWSASPGPNLPWSNLPLLPTISLIYGLPKSSAERDFVTR